MTASEKAILLPILAAALVAGLLLGAQWDIRADALWLFVLASVLLVVLSASLRRTVLPALALVAVFLGLLRAGQVEAPGTELRPHHNVSGVEIQGLILDDPTDSDPTVIFRLSVERLRTDSTSDWTDVSGDLRVTARATSEIVEAREPPFFRYGDRLHLTGRLQTPEPLGDFDFPAYLERQGIGTVMSFPGVQLVDEGGGNAFYRWLYSVRRGMAGALTRVVPEPQASFGQSILLGIRDNLPDSLKEDFRRTGASHLLAISGLHVGILLVLSISASAFVFDRRRQIYLLAPLAVIWLYVLLSGASPSATRAAVMGTMYLGAIAVGRPRSLTPSLALAAGVMSAIDPRILSSVSFQLSFAAMMGISIYHESLSDRIHEKLGIGPEHDGLIIQTIRGAVSITGITIAATVATAPLVGFYFDQVSMVGLPTTLLTLPIVPFALLAHGSTALVGLLSEAVAMPFGWFAWGLSAYVTGVVSLMARVPSASLGVGEFGPALVWVYYIVLAGVALLMYSYIPWRRWRSISLPSVSTPRSMLEKSPPWQITAVAIVAAALVWTAALSQSNGQLKVVFADVGQGDMAVITTPAGNRIVVDGGPDGVRAAQMMGDQLPFWERTVDLMVLTHPHSDHVAGLNEILRRYNVERILERRQTYTSPEYTAWARLVESEGVEVLQAKPGMTIAFDDGVSVQVLSPPDPLLTGTSSDTDNGSLVVRVVYGRASFLLTGDAFHEAETWMVQSDQSPASSVLKIGHHGSRTSSTEDFLRAVSPAAAVISAGQDNRFGHPDPAVVERLNTFVPESQLFVTSERGSVTFKTDGEVLRVDTER